MCSAWLPGRSGHLPDLNLSDVAWTRTHSAGLPGGHDSVDVPPERTALAQAIPRAAAFGAFLSCTVSHNCPASLMPSSVGVAGIALQQA